MKPDNVFKIGDLVRERPTEWGLVVTAGPKTFDVVFISGFVSRHKQGQKDYVFERADSSSFDDKQYEQWVREHLAKEAVAVREERRLGLRIKRGAVHPSR